MEKIGQRIAQEANLVKAQRMKAVRELVIDNDLPVQVRKG